jgi:O-antigen ligase
MAVEPSWFADQLVLLYLPLWLGSVLRRTSAFARRARWPSVEMVLLGWGTILLVLTSSRGGYAAWGLVLLTLAIWGGWALGGRASTRFAQTARLGGPATGAGLRRFARPLGAGLAVLALALAGVLVLLLSARLDRRMDRLFRLELESEPGRQQPIWLSVATQLEYAERLTYWTAASRVFALHPILGVGLGNSGFFFPRVIPATGYELIDVLGAVGELPGTFPNPKSLWFRLLAETGLVGFVLFVTWLVVIGICAWDLQRRDRGLSAVVGLASLFFIVAFLIEGFSLDTFALPYPWLLLGMTTGIWSQQSAAADRT